MSNPKSKKRPTSKLQKSQKSNFYNLVKHDADLLNKSMKWLIIIHYPLYIILLFVELFKADYTANGYVGPASMVFPMSLSGSIILEIVYFFAVTYITVSLAIAMKSYKENNPKYYIK